MCQSFKKFYILVESLMVPHLVFLETWTCSWLGVLLLWWTDLVAAQINAYSNLQCEYRYTGKLKLSSIIFNLNFHIQKIRYTASHYKSSQTSYKGFIWVIILITMCKKCHDIWIISVYITRLVFNIWFGVIATRVFWTNTVQQYSWKQEEGASVTSDKQCFYWAAGGEIYTILISCFHCLDLFGIQMQIPFTQRHSNIPSIVRCLFQCCPFFF